MQRVTSKNVDARVETANRMLRRPVRVSAGGEYGRTALDLCDDDGVVRRLTTGTKREVYDYLGAMIETLTIVGRTEEA